MLVEAGLLGSPGGLTLRHQAESIYRRLALGPDGRCTATNPKSKPIFVEAARTSPQ